MFIFSTHALKRMFQRGLSVAMVENVVNKGIIISTYPEDKPYPSRLVLGWNTEQPIHVVAANDEDGNIVVITAYVPDASLWDASFTRKLP